MRLFVWREIIYVIRKGILFLQEAEFIGMFEMHLRIVLIETVSK
jgi:hypothetical protein